MHKQIIEKAHTVFENKGGDYFAIKSRFGDVVIGGSYSKDFVEQYAKLNVNVVVTQAKGVAEPIGTPPKSPQEIRDDIVAQAKRVVAELEDWMEGGGYRSFDTFPQYILNRETRTVVALIKAKSSWPPIKNTLLAKGIAKCDPSDCFNSHIGKAIALRRALGLEVPAEYFKAPQPTEVRVGDVVHLITIDTTDTVNNEWYKKEAQRQVNLGIIEITDDSRDACPQ